MGRVTVDQAQAEMLLARIRAGDEARQKLAELVEPLVRSEARHYKVPGATASEIEQTVRTACVKASLAWRFGKGMSLTSWLKRATRNAVIDQARKAFRTKSEGSDDRLDSVEDATGRIEVEAASEAVKKRAKEIAGWVASGIDRDSETLRLLNFCRSHLPGYGRFALSPTDETARALVLELLGVYREVALSLESGNGTAGAAKYARISLVAAGIVTRDLSEAAESEKRRRRVRGQQ